MTERAARAVIRRARLTDAAVLAHTHVACWRETYRGLVPDALLDHFSLDKSGEVWNRILAESVATEAADREAEAVFVAEIGGRMAGFASCGSQRTPELAAKTYTGEITAIYLLQAAQHQGVGIQLMRQLASELAARQCRAASLWVHRDNLTARRFYERCGGVLVGEKREVRDGGILLEVAYGWPTLDDLLMRLDARQEKASSA